MTAFESTISDAEAMARARGGDWESFGHLVERHRDPLVRYLARLVANRGRGEELAQEAFVKLWLAAGRYREEGRFEAYLYRIATRLARSSERRSRLHWRALVAGRFGHPQGRPNGAEPFEAAEAGERLLREERELELARALAELPLKFRVPLVLVAIEERPVEEVAQLLGLPPSTVKTRLFRARHRLRLRLQPYFRGGEP